MSRLTKWLRSTSSIDVSAPKSRGEVPRVRRTPSVQPSHALRELADNYYGENDTARKPDWYLEFYEELFGGLRDQPISLLEIGVKEGASIRMWRDYFPEATITGIDLREQPERYPQTAHFVRGSQADHVVLSRAAQLGGPFDVIIDDAAHIGGLAKASFWFLFEEHLKPGGLYVIEDCSVALTRKDWRDWHPYTPPLDAGKKLPSFQYGTIGLVKQLVDEMFLRSSIAQIQMRCSVAVIYKQMLLPGSNLPGP